MQKGRQRAQWADEYIIKLPGAVEAQSFSQEGCPGNQLTLSPHQQAQEWLSTGVGGLGLLLTEVRPMSASNGSRVETLPEVIAEMTGPVGDRVMRGLLELNIIRRQHDGDSRHIEGNEESDGQESSPSLGWNGV